MSAHAPTKSIFSSLWESILAPREVHAILKYKLTAPILDTSLQTLDAAEILSDFDFCYLCLAKFSPSIAELILTLSREVRDSACVYYLFTYAMEAIVNDPDLSIDRKSTLLSHFPQIIVTLSSTATTAQAQADPNSPLDPAVLRQQQQLQQQQLISQWKLEGIGSTDDERQFLQTFWKIISFFHNFLDPKFQEVIRVYVLKASQLHVAVLTLAPQQQQQQQHLTTSPHTSPLLTTAASPASSRIQYNVDTVDQYNQHCMLRNGLLFECTDQLFVQTGLMLHATQGVVSTGMLAASAGIFVQKVNLIRNFRSNLFQNKTLWPAEIWSLYAQHLDWFTQHNSHIRARLCLNHMVLDALKHGLDAIQYLSLVQHHPPTFQFLAIQIITAFSILGGVFNQPEIFSSSFTLRTGLLCDIALNCDSLATAKGYIFQAIGQIDRELVDPELDPIYLQPTITREEIAKAVAQFQELTHYLTRSKQFCLGFDPISSGWPTVFKWVGITASAMVAFKYLTDYNHLWDDEIALRHPRGKGGAHDLERFRPERGKRRPNGFAYQRADLQLDDYLPPEHQAQTLDNIMRTGGHNVGHNRFLTELLQGSPKSTQKLDAGLARAEAFMTKLQRHGPDTFSNEEIQRELASLEKLLGSSFDNAANQVSFEEVQKLIGGIGADPAKETRYSRTPDETQQNLPVGFVKDMYLADKHHLPHQSFTWREEEGGITHSLPTDDASEYDELDSFSANQGNLDRLLAMANGEDLETMPDDKFFETIAKAMNHGAGKK